jgi:hypothetical protein
MGVLSFLSGTLRAYPREAGQGLVE